jgi:thiamine biosynthesis lipoprotein
MDPMTGAPLRSSPASATVVARTSAEADAWATALMVLGPEAGGELAVRHGLDALFLERRADGVQTCTVGPLFDDRAASRAGGERYVVS